MHSAEHPGAAVCIIVKQRAPEKNKTLWEELHSGGHAHTWTLKSVGFREASRKMEVFNMESGVTGGRDMSGMLFSSRSYSTGEDL